MTKGERRRRAEPVKEFGPSARYSLSPHRGERDGVRGAARESALGEVSPCLSESEAAKSPVSSTTLPLPHAPLTPTLSPQGGRGSALPQVEKPDLSQAPRRFAAFARL